MIRFNATNLFDSGTLTASTEDAAYPKENLRHPFRALTTRTTAIAAQWWKVDLGSAKGFTFAALLNHNLTAGDTVSVQANATDSWGAPSFSQALTVVEGGIICAYFARQTYRWVRFAVAKASGTYIEAGRAIVADHYAPAANYATGMQAAVEDLSTGLLTISGQYHGDILPIRRVFTLPFSRIGTTQKQEIEAIHAIVHTVTPFMVTLDDANVQPSSYYVRFKQGPQFTADPQFPKGDRWNGSITLEEML